MFDNTLWSGNTSKPEKRESGPNTKALYEVV